MSLTLNTLKPAVGAKRVKNRVGRGGGSGNGKTCGRGHKGQTSRSGYSQKIGFEGGQMPLQRRLPKFGFTSKMKPKIAEVRLKELNSIDKETITLEDLKKAGIVPGRVTRAKIILAGSINRAVNISGLMVTKGARIAIESLGGKVE